MDAVIVKEWATNVGCEAAAEVDRIARLGGRGLPIRLELLRLYAGLEHSTMLVAGIAASIERAEAEAPKGGA